MQKVGCTGYFCLILAVFMVVAVCFFTGCDDGYPEGNTLTFSDLQLTLPGDFMNLAEENIDADADFLYGRKTLIVKGAAEEKSKLQEMSLEEYTALVISGNQLNTTPVAFGKGYTFTYESTVGSESYTYITATFQGSEHFWLFQLYCPTADLAENQPEIDMILSGIRPNNT